MKILEKHDMIRYDIKKLLPEKVFNQLADKYISYKHMKIDRYYRDDISKAIKNIDPRYPDWIEIETINRCNNDCQFCPVHQGADPRPLIRMNDDLFKRIIDMLRQIDYRGNIALFCNNEPLLDKKIIERIAYAKEQLPHAFHYLYTNGSLLTPEKFESLMKYLDILIIDNYNNQDCLNPAIRTLYEKYGEQYPNAFIWMRRTDEIYCTRGGHAPNRARIKSFKSDCTLPFRHMYIRPDGKVGLCCQDAVWTFPALGDLSTASLMDVWNSSGYNILRYVFGTGRGRAGIPICEGCDFMSLGKNFDLFLKEES